MCELCAKQQVTWERQHLWLLMNLTSIGAAAVIQPNERRSVVFAIVELPKQPSHKI